MQTHTLVKSVDPYLNAQWLGSAAPWSRPAKESLPFITVSREAGSGGPTLASLLARKLNASAPDPTIWRVFAGNLIARMLEENHLSTHLARFLPEQKVPELKASIGEIVGLHPNLWEMVQKTNDTMRHLAQAGHAILVGRGANLATAGLPGGFHVLLVAPAARRAQYLMSRYGITEKEAYAYNRECNAARCSYVKAHFGADMYDRYAYDLVINTADFTFDEAADLIVSHISKKSHFLERAA